MIKEVFLDRNYNANFDGSGVTAYVIDTAGVNTTRIRRACSFRAMISWIMMLIRVTVRGMVPTLQEIHFGGSQYGVAKNVDIVGSSLVVRVQEPHLA
ncbi:hypothetical protein OH492_27310 [Vibrio chagasii]|nr:hypothetical protein [Vibrio chagasii]